MIIDNKLDFMTTGRYVLKCLFGVEYLQTWFQMIQVLIKNNFEMKWFIFENFNLKSKSAKLKLNCIFGPTIWQMSD